MRRKLHNFIESVEVFSNLNESRFSYKIVGKPYGIWDVKVKGKATPDDIIEVIWHILDNGHDMAETDDNYMEIDGVSISNPNGNTILKNEDIPKLWREFKRSFRGARVTRAMRNDIRWEAKLKDSQGVDGELTVELLLGHDQGLNGVEVSYFGTYPRKDDEPVDHGHPTDWDNIDRQY